MISWGWLILSFLVGFLVGQRIERRRLKILQEKIEAMEKLVNNVKEKVDEQYPGAS